MTYRVWPKILLKPNENEFIRQEKKRLFEEGYLAARSGHSRGSTLDLND